MVHFSEIRFIGNLEDEHLQESSRARRKTRHRDRDRDAIHLPDLEGVRSEAQGTARGAAHPYDHTPPTVVGSPIVRCFLGTFADRTGALPIEGHIENTVEGSAERCGRRPSISGLKIAIENHAGDMQGAGTEDADRGGRQGLRRSMPRFGQPALGDRRSAPDARNARALCAHEPHPRHRGLAGAGGRGAVQWVRMGEGNIGIAEYVEKYRELCPGRALSLEIIVTKPRMFPYLRSEVLGGVPHHARLGVQPLFAIAERGKPKPSDPPSAERTGSARQEREDLEASIRWTKERLSRMSGVLAGKSRGSNGGEQGHRRAIAGVRGEGAASSYAGASKTRSSRSRRPRPAPDDRARGVPCRQAGRYRAAGSD